MLGRRVEPGLALSRSREGPGAEQQGPHPARAPAALGGGLAAVPDRLADMPICGADLRRPELHYSPAPPRPTAAAAAAACAAPNCRRSLANTLNVLRRRLGQLQGEQHTKEDLAHYKVGEHAGAPLRLSCRRQYPRASARLPGCHAAVDRAGTHPRAAPCNGHPRFPCSWCWTTSTRAGGTPRAPLRGGWAPPTPRPPPFAPASSTSASVRSASMAGRPPSTGQAPHLRGHGTSALAALPAPHPHLNYPARCEPAPPAPPRPTGTDMLERMQHSVVEMPEELRDMHRWG